ncbi:MAG TPA: glycosyltransferase family 39 protein [bacterium]|nr:glycosyltransferase family 39 protein [bacterium]
MRGALPAVLLAAALLFFAGLGRATLFDQDEAKYTQVAREILRTGDPITLHVNGRPWFVHPPLYIWLVAATGRVLGFTEFTARLWSAVAALVGLYATYLLGRLWFTPRAALLAVVVLASTFQYFAHARLAVFDGLLVAFMLLAFHALLLARAGRPRRLYAAALWAGCGTLTKGPIALLLPLLAVAAFLLLRRQRPGLPVRAVAGAAAVYALVAVPWYAAEWVRHGMPFLRTVLGYYTLHRFVGVVEGQSGPWWYYGPVLILGAFPWTAFLAAMLPYHLRRRAADGSLHVLLWVAVTVAFYSAAGTKLPNYILPLYPFAALGIGAMWDAALAGEREARRGLGAAFAGTAAALVLFAAEIALFARLKYPGALDGLQPHLVLVAFILAVWLAAAAALYAVALRRASFAMTAGTMWVLAAFLVFGTLPRIDAARPIKPVAAAVRERLGPGEKLVGYRISDHQTLLFYTDWAVEWLDDPAAVRELVCRHPRAVIVGRPAELARLRGDLEAGGAAQVRPIITRAELAAIEAQRAGTCGQP